MHPEQHLPGRRLRWLDASIALDPNFCNQRAKAMFLAKKNDFKGAVTWAEKALAAAKSAAQPPTPQGLGPGEERYGVEGEGVGIR